MAKDNEIDILEVANEIERVPHCLLYSLKVILRRGGGSCVEYDFSQRTHSLRSRGMGWIETKCKPYTGEIGAEYGLYNPMAR